MSQIQFKLINYINIFFVTKGNEWIVSTQMDSNLACTYVNNINTSCFISNVYYSFGHLIKKWSSPSGNIKHLLLNVFHSFYPCVSIIFYVFYFSRLCLHCFSLALLFLYVPKGGTVYTRSPTDANKPHLNGRAMCQILKRKHMHTLHGKKSHQDILILFGCSPSCHAPLCQPAAHTALQLWFYIPVRQNYSLVHNVSQIRRS